MKALPLPSFWSGILLAGMLASGWPGRLEGQDLPTARQLILVTTADWDSVAATLTPYARDAAGAWQQAMPPCPAVVGRKGLGWGLGLHSRPEDDGPVKREGDGRAPAGIYAIEELFGEASAEQAAPLRLPYRQMTAAFAGVDDPGSRHYNRIVDGNAVTRDWKSAEVMLRPDGLYRWGAVVRHNWQQQPGAGSCIFLHVWRAAGSGTSGCTAMKETHLVQLLRWMDAEMKPLLVQLPSPVLRRVRTAWGLP